MAVGTKCQQLPFAIQTALFAVPTPLTNKTRALWAQIKKEPRRLFFLLI